ncbi:MAG: class I SAM-dependent methyltransferase [Candidatus Odinarchaeota archaeon]
MTSNHILTEIKKFLSYSKARHYIEFDDDIYCEVSGLKAKIVNFFNLIYKIINLKSGKIQINERIVEIPFLYKNLDFHKMNKILDLGCVGSKISLQLSSLGYQVVGVDYRPFIFKHKNLKFIQGNFFDIDLANESFDCVICISTIEHIGLPAYNIDPFEHGDKKAIEKIYNLLKRGGKLILTVPFGKATVNQFERNYDQKSLEQLIERFTIQEFKIYERSKSGWILSYNSSNNSKKVACVVGVKV